MGKKSGNGTFYYANGDLYEGGWVAGKLTSDSLSLLALLVQKYKY